MNTTLLPKSGTNNPWQSRHPAPAVALIFFLLLSASSAHAAVKTWDGSSSVNWGTAANWAGGVAPVDGDDLIFPAGAANLNNTNNIAGLDLRSLTFNGAGGGYTLNGNAITISTTDGINADHTVGANTINFDTTLTTNMTFSCPNAAVSVTINGNLALGTFLLTVTATGDIFLGGGISGTGGLTKSGTGTLRFFGGTDNTYTGTTTVIAGTLECNKFHISFPISIADTAIAGDLVVGSGSAGPDVVRLLFANQIANTSDITINAAGLLDLNGDSDTIGTLTFSSGGVVTNTGTGVLTLSGNVTATSLGSGTFPNCIIYGGLSLGASTRTFTVNSNVAGADLTINAVVSGTGGLTKAGAGTMTLTGANTYTGVTTVNTGILNVNDNLALGGTAGGTVVNGTAALILNNASITNEVLTLNSINPSGALQVEATGDWIGDITLNTNVVIEASSLLQLGGAINGPGGFTKVGLSTLAMIGTNANTYTGTTVVDSGTLLLSRSSFDGAVPGDLVIGDGTGTDTVQTTVGSQISNTGTITMNVGSVLDLGTFVEAVNNVVMTGASVNGTGALFNLLGSLSVNASSVQSTINKELRLTTDRVITVANGTASSDLLVNGLVSGGGGFTKLGEGQMQLAVSNSYSGLTVVAAGLLTVNDDNGLGATTSGTVVSNGASLAIGTVVAVGAEPLTLNGPGSATHGFGALYGFTGPNSWAGNITLASYSTIEENSSTLTLSGILSGAGGFTKTGDGTVILSGASANTFGGGLTVESGVLELAKVLAINSSSLLVIGDGTGGINADVVRYTANNAIDTSVPIIINESGLLDLNGFSDSVGALTLIGGDITTGAGTMTIVNNLTATSTSAGSSANISGNLNLGAATRTFTVTNGPSTPDLRILAAVSGSGGIVKAEAGMMSLETSNSFTGAVTINDGSIRANDNFSLGTVAGGVTVNGDAVLQLSSAHVGAETLTLNSTSGNALQATSGSNSWSGTITLSADAGIAPNLVTDTLNLLGTITGPGEVNKNSSGTLHYSGATANTYNGVTTVNQGTLVLNKSVGPAVPGSLVIGDGTGGANADVVRL